MKHSLNKINEIFKNAVKNHKEKKFNIAEKLYKE